MASDAVGAGPAGQAAPGPAEAADAARRDLTLASEAAEALWQAVETGKELQTQNLHGSDADDDDIA